MYLFIMTGLGDEWEPAISKNYIEMNNIYDPHRYLGSITLFWIGGTTNKSTNFKALQIFRLFS